MMKKTFWLMIVLVMVLTACQPGSQPALTVENTPVPAPALPQAYPDPAGGFANPGAASEYPPPGDPATAASINWEEAASLIAGGTVAHIASLSSGEVVLTLKDARVFKSVEPTPGEITRLREQCGFLCDGMSITGP
jgi:hypothetical protein